MKWNMDIKMIKRIVMAVCIAATVGTLSAKAAELMPSNYAPRAVATADSRMQQVRSVDPGTVYQNRYQGYEQLPEPLKDSNVDVQASKSVKTPHVGGVMSDDILMYIEHIQFEGNTVISTSKLQEFASKELIGRDVTLTRVGKFADQVTKLYQDQGFITSFAFLPPQTIKDKTVTIQIIEGKVGDVAISGNKFSSTNFIKYQLLKPYYMEHGEILNVNDIRQGLIELNEKGFISGTIVLEKGREQGTTDLKLAVKEHQPFTLSAGFDNAGRDLIGEHRGSLFLSDNNLTGHGDVLSIGASVARRSFSIGPQYSLPVGNRGDSVYASYGYSHVKPGGDFKPLKYVGKAHIYSFGVKNPLYHSRNVNLDLNSSFNFKEGDFTISPTGEKYQVGDYSIRTLETGVHMVQKDKLGRTYVTTGANIGMPILGGKDDSHFLTLNGGVMRQFWLPKKGVVMVRFNGQVSPDNNVPAIEQFQVGGFNTVRGYDEGTLLGKSGWTAGVQVNTPIPFLPNKVGEFPLRERIQLVGFYDCGYARTKDYDLGTEFMQSMGTGLRVYLTKYLTASVDFGFPIGERPDGSHRFRTHFFLTSNIL